MVRYVRRVPPFDRLAEDAFLAAAPALEIGVFEAGRRLVSAGGEPLRHLYVVRKGAVRLERDGKVLQVLEEGEVFGYTSLISGEASLDVVVEDELLAYCLPAEEFESLLADARFAAHFAVGLTDRLKASLDEPSAPRFEPDVGIEVGQLVRRPAVWVAADATVREAARVMRDEHVSSVLLRLQPPGIVTDRDLRNRVLGEDLDPGTPAARVCSRPLLTVAAATPLYEAWRTFLDHGVNHLPVVREGETVGVLTSTDLLRHSAQGPVAVLRRFERLTSREALPAYAGKLTEMASALLAAGLDAVVVAGFVAQLNGSLVRRLLSLAEEELGPAPAPYGWFASGAAGRREQTLLPARPAAVDGHHEGALVYSDEGEPSAAWFERLAGGIDADLAAAGFRPPPQRAARARAHPLSDWIRRIEASAAERPWEAARAFDARRVAGTLDVGPLEAALERVRRGRLFVPALARQALSVRPPPMLLLRLRGGSARVDLERQALAPIVHLARCVALDAGRRGHGTLERLDAARDAGIVSEGTHAAVAEAFRFLLTLHLTVQLRAAAAGAAAGEEVALSELTAIERTRLKDALRAVHRWQEIASYRYQPDRAGSGPGPG